MNDLVILRLDSARQALTEAKTILATKQVVDLAHAAEIYAKRQGLSDDIIHRAHAIKIEALAKLGAMLKTSDRHPPGPDRYGRMTDPDLPPTLGELGIKKNTSSLAQRIANLPQAALDAVTAGRISLKNAIKRHDRQERARVVVTPTAMEGVDIRHCSMAELLKGQIGLDAIITDPPYGKQYLDLYRELAELAAGALTEDGILAVMCGQSYLPEIFASMSRFIKYRWTLAYLTPGQSPQIWDRKVNTFWKPILLFGASKNWIGDVIRSDMNDKRFHDWGQSEIGTARLIEALTKPGDLVCDPFLGGGTTAVACVKLGRRFIGCDQKEDCIATTNRRLSSN